MDSIFLVDTTGRQEFNGEQQQKKIVYNKELLLTESDAHSEEDEEQNEGAVELFGLKLNSKEVLDVVNSLPDRKKPVSKVAKKLEDLCEKVESAVENSSKPKVVPRKRVTELNHDAPHLDLRQENLESNMKRTKQALNPGLEQAHALPTVGKRQQPIINRVSVKRFVRTNSPFAHDEIFDIGVCALATRPKAQTLANLVSSVVIFAAALQNLQWP